MCFLFYEYSVVFKVEKKDLKSALIIEQEGISPLALGLEVSIWKGRVELRPIEQNQESELGIERASYWLALRVEQLTW